jgi:hypothetical protein
MHEIHIKAGHVSIKAVLHDTPTASEIRRILPIRGTVQLWGDEIYFTIPLKTGLEPDARQDAEVGEIGYWPTGPALCIFFGPTPASTGPKPRAYSPVNIVGRVMGDPAVLKGIPEGAEILIHSVKE